MELDATADRLVKAAMRVAKTLRERRLGELDDAALLAMLTDATEASRAAGVVVAAAAAVADRRSSNERGAGGFAQKNGHRTATTLVQTLTGQSRADTARALRAGHDLIDPPVDTAGPDEPATPAPDIARWRMLLRDALADGRVSTTQHQAIRTGLGEPPVERYPDLDPAFLPEAWARAVEILLDEAAALTVEDLRAAARTARDRLDPVGVGLRYDERRETRSYRSWLDENGQRHAHIVFDDDGAAWADAILTAAVRSPRSPRFTVEGAEADGDADGRVEDTRSTVQRQYDHLISTLRTGAQADPDQTLDVRQPAVRIVIESKAFTIGDDGELHATGVGHVEDGGAALPGSVIEKYLCDAGAIPVITDPFGRPLDLGREKRLFTQRQRIAIIAREGGCIGLSCDSPASLAEIHHIGHWWEHLGRTDVDDGVPLCPPCHLHLHNTGARIKRTRDPATGRDTYWMHYPPDPDTGVVPEPVRLRSRSPLRFEAA